jgi:hypothetical protein
MDRAQNAQEILEIGNQRVFEVGHEIGPRPD